MRASDLEFNSRPGHPRPFESLWSAVHKFIYLNCSSNLAFVRYFSNGRPGYRDLRFAGSIDVGRFARAMGAKPRWSLEATCDRYSSVVSPHLANAPFLRFCPVCIEQGFHSPLFQLVDCRVCPAHGEYLNDSCPRCGTRLEIGFPKKGRAPYSCSHCGHLLWLDLGAESWPLAFETSEKEEAFNGAASDRWQGANAAKLTGGPRSASVWAAVYQVFTPTGALGHLAARHLADPVANVTTIRRAWGREFWTKRVVRRVPESVYCTIPLNDTDFGVRLWQIYRLIERRLYWRVRNRRRAYVNLLRRNGRTAPFLGFKVSKPLLAYLVWRGYWEQTSSLLRKQRRYDQPDEKCDWRVKMASSVFWRFTQHARLLRHIDCFTSGDEWAQLHFFSIVAMATFRAAETYVSDLEKVPNAFELGHGPMISQINPPMVLLEKISRRGNAFELKIRTTYLNGTAPVKEALF